MQDLNLKRTIFPADVKIHNLVDLPIYPKLNEGRKADDGLEMVPRQIISVATCYYPEVKALRYKRLLEPTSVDSLIATGLPEYQKLAFIDVVEEFFV